MTPSEIPIANIYYLLCYAWDVLQEKDSLIDVDAAESTDLVDLFARVLVSGTRHLLRRGLDRGYLSNEDEIAGVRGKLLVTQTQRRQLLRQGRAACQWDELEYDTLPNRILKTTLRRLQVAESLDQQTRTDVADLLRWLEPVQVIALRAEHFRRIQLHRNNRLYGFLLHVCEFLFEHWLPEQGGSEHLFRDFERDQLPQLFEKFVFNFFQLELPATEWSVTRSKIFWQMSAPNEDARKLVPEMQTDVCLKSRDRAIILDTKFYAQALKERHRGNAKLPSSNLYQLFTYLRQQSHVSGWEQSEGVLLYPRTTQTFDVDFVTHGHRMRALTLDLTMPWHNVRQSLLVLVGAS